MKLKQDEHNEKMEDKDRQKTETEHEFTLRSTEIKNQFNAEKKRRQDDEKEKTNADFQRFTELQAKKEEQSKRCKILLSEIFDKHKKLVTEMKAAHKMKKDQLKLEKETLNSEIEDMIKQHAQVREKVENDSWDFIERLKEKHSQELASEVDKGMKQKSELSLIIANFNKQKADKQA